MAKLEFSIKGPFMAYGSSGETTFLDFKPTGFTPQKSHIIGMIGAGLGVKRNELPKLSEKLEVSVKPLAHYPKVYHDYQVVSPKGTDFSTKKLYKQIDKDGKAHYVSALEYTGFNARPEDMTKLPAAKGGSSSTGASKIIKKDYLVDCEFTVEVLGEKAELERVKNGLMHPYYPLFLGRKNCIATKIKVGEIH